MALSGQKARQSGESMIYVDKGDSGQPAPSPFLRTLRVSYRDDGCGGAWKCRGEGRHSDNMEGLQPQTEIYTDHAAKWLAPVAGAARFAQVSIITGIGPLWGT